MKLKEQRVILYLHTKNGPRKTILKTAPNSFNYSTQIPFFALARTFLGLKLFLTQKCWDKQLCRNDLSTSCAVIFQSVQKGLA